MPEPKIDIAVLPEDVSVEFIDTEEKVLLLCDLVGQKYLGIDSQWKPIFHRDEKNQGVSIL